MSTAFGWADDQQVAADANGTYTFENVPVGRFSVTGRDPATSRAGSATGQITQHAQVVTTTITVASFVSAGTVYRVDGTTIVAGARVVANSVFTTIADSDGRFAFPILPLGFVQLVTTDASTNGVGITSTSLSTNGQLRTADVASPARPR